MAEGLTETITIQVSPTEKQVIHTRATEDRRTLSAMCRHLILLQLESQSEKQQRELGEAQRQPS